MGSTASTWQDNRGTSENVQMRSPDTHHIVQIFPHLTFTSSVNSKEHVMCNRFKRKTKSSSAYASGSNSSQRLFTIPLYDLCHNGINI